MDPSRPARRAMAKLPGAGLAQAVPRTMTFLAGSELRRANPFGRRRPTARPSPQYAAQVALDEALLGVMASSRMPTPSDYPLLGAEVVEADRVWAEQGWLDDPRSYHQAPPPLADVRITKRKSRGVRFEHVSFASEYRPHACEPGAGRWEARERDKTAHAWVLRHSGPPRPWLICLHGMGMGSPLSDLSTFKARELFVGRGLNLLMPVLPAHGPRKLDGRRLPDVPGPNQVDLIHLLAQAIWDVRRLVSWVQGDGAGEIGAYGISLGGYVASLLAIHEPAVTSVIAGVPVSDFERLERHHANRSQRRRGLQHHLMGDEVQRILSVVSPLALEPYPVRDRLAVYGGLGDRIATPAQAELLWEHWARPAVCWYPGGHIGFMWSSQVERFVAERLDVAFGPPLQKAQKAHNAALA